MNTCWARKPISFRGKASVEVNEGVRISAFQTNRVLLAVTIVPNCPFTSK